MANSYKYQVPLGQSLSARGVAYLTGPEGSSILFNNDVNLNGTLVSLNANGYTFKLDTSYNNSNFSIILRDKTSTKFTVVTGTATQVLTDSGFDSVGPEIRRIATLGYF